MCLFEVFQPISIKICLCFEKGTTGRAMQSSICCQLRACSLRVTGQGWEVIKRLQESQQHTGP